jgi:hypothetical protein
MIFTGLVYDFKVGDSTNTRAGVFVARVEGLQMKENLFSTIHRGVCGMRIVIPVIYERVKVRTSVRYVFTEPPCG